MMSLWPAMLLVGGLMAAAPATDKADESIEVRIRGTLQAGMMAIGGETTGYQISARGVTWELDFGANAVLQRKADGLDGKPVVVTGTLEARAGVEIPTRTIVKVESLEAAGAARPPGKH
jgi:hypothetical protein